MKRKPVFSAFLSLAVLATGVLPAVSAWAEETGGDDIGFPQLNAASYPSQVFWLFVSFAVLYTLMSKIALPRVAEVLEHRRAQSAGNLEKAATLSEEAEKIRESFEKSLVEAHRAADVAIASAEKEASEKINEEQRRYAETARKRLVVTEQNISKARAEALQSLADISAEIAVEMVGKIADVQINKADAKKAVASVMQKG